MRCDAGKHDKSQRSNKRVHDDCHEHCGFPDCNGSAHPSKQRKTTHSFDKYYDRNNSSTKHPRLQPQGDINIDYDSSESDESSEPEQQEEQKQERFEATTKIFSPAVPVVDPMCESNNISSFIKNSNQNNSHSVASSMPSISLTNIERQNLSSDFYTDTGIVTTSIFSGVRSQSNINQPFDFTHLIFQDLSFQQQMSMPSSDYMKSQPDVNEQMRSILIDWLVEVAEEYDFKPSTLFLTVSVIDRLLSLVQVRRDKLQLVGMTAMVIAAKNQEYSSPELEDFVLISDNTYSKRELIHMEGQILTLMEFKVNAPTIFTFLQRFQTVGKLDEEAAQLSNYLAELSLLDYSFLKYEPNKIAASAVALSLHSLGCVPWSPVMKMASGFDITEISECAEKLLSLYASAPNMQLVAIHEKYSSPNPHLSVATLPPPTSFPVT